MTLKLVKPHRNLWPDTDPHTRRLLWLIFAGLLLVAVVLALTRG